MSVRACSSIPQNGDNKFQQTQFWSWFSRKTPMNSLDLMNGFRHFEDPLLQRSSPWLPRTTYSPAGCRTGRWIKIGQDFVVYWYWHDPVRNRELLASPHPLSCSGFPAGFGTTFQPNHANLLQVQKSLEDATTHLTMHVSWIPFSVSRLSKSSLCVSAPRLPRGPAAKQRPTMACSKRQRVA